MKTPQNKKTNRKLWGGRFQNEPNALLEEINASLAFDKQLFREDIQGSIAHARMLGKTGIISAAEARTLERELKLTEEKIRSGRFIFNKKDEDIHSAIEKDLAKRIPHLAGKLHTARSRNDQVSCDLRLFLRKAIDRQIELLLVLLETLVQKATKHQKTLMPGTTHFQSAQPITFAFYLLAYFFMFERDLARLKDARKRLNVNPLGAGAFAGVAYAIDRKETMRTLNFEALAVNAMDAVSERDFVLEYESAAALFMMHCSRLCEELITYSNPNFAFFELPDEYATGSSMMPNKKNPDALELIRGKSGRVYGAFFSLLSVMTSLPLAYNKDMQEDKEGVFDVIKTLELVLQLLPPHLTALTVKEKNMRRACEKGFLAATEVADYLTRKGLPFREAHSTSGQLVRFLEKKQCSYENLSLAEFQQFSPLFEADIKKIVELETQIKNKKSAGSTSFTSVQQQLRMAKSRLKTWRKLSAKH